MLSKGSELFMFEGDLFALKKKYINMELEPSDWKQLFQECDNLLSKYNVNDKYFYYMWLQIDSFLKFLEVKQEGNYKL